MMCILYNVALVSNIIHLKSFASRTRNYVELSVRVYKHHNSLIQRIMFLCSNEFMTFQCYNKLITVL